MSTALPVRVASDHPSQPNAAPVDGVPSAFYLEAIRARAPSRTCEVCGDPVGAARLTLHRDATACAWCATHHGRGSKTH